MTNTLENFSGIVFDDPVSSLDHEWRDKVACRLVEEAEKRQDTHKRLNDWVKEINRRRSQR